jgi:hypothetical protein
MLLHMRSTTASFLRGFAGVEDEPVDGAILEISLARHFR